MTKDSESQSKGGRLVRLVTGSDDRVGGVVIGWEAVGSDGHLVAWSDSWMFIDYATIVQF